MFTNTLSSIKKAVYRPIDVRMIVFILTLVLFILGAGAPSTSGGLGG